MFPHWSDMLYNQNPLGGIFVKVSPLLPTFASYCIKQETSSLYLNQLERTCEAFREHIQVPH